MKRIRHTSSRAQSCEPLERRRLLATFTVSGTIGPDTISLSSSGLLLVAVVNGTPQTVFDSAVDDVLISAGAGNDTIEIHGSGSNAVSVNAGAGDDTIRLMPTSQDLDLLGAPISANGGIGDDALVLFDQNDTVNRTWTFANTSVTRSGSPAISFAAFESVDVNHGAFGGKVIFQDPVAATVNITAGAASTTAIDLIGAPGENATISPGGVEPRAGRLAFAGRTVNFTSASVNCTSVDELTIVSPNPADSLNFGTSGGGRSQLAWNSGGIAMPGVSLVGTSHLTLELGANDALGGDDVVRVGDGLPGAALLTINYATGSNEFSLGGGSCTLATQLATGDAGTLDVSIVNATLTFANNQHLRRLETKGGTVRFNGTGAVMEVDDLIVLGPFVGTTLRLDAGQSATVNGAFSIDGGMTLTLAGSGTFDVHAAQSHAIGAGLFASAGTLNLFTDAGSTSSRTLSLSCGAASVNLFSSQHLSSLSVQLGTTTVAPGGSRVLVTDTLIVSPGTGRLDLADNQMIIHEPAPATFDFHRSLILEGYAGGAWNGTGITSSVAAASGGTAALGHAESAELFSVFPATFAGEPVGGTALLIRHTLYGDADLDGQVNLGDFNRVAGNFGGAGKRWAHGDFDFNQLVNLADFNGLASAFGQSSLRRDVEDDLEDSGRLADASPGRVELGL